MTVAHKGMALVAVPLLFQCVFVLVIVRLQFEQTRGARWATHTKEVIARVREVQALVADACAGVRGYLITRDPTFAEPFYRGRRDLPPLCDQLCGLVQDNPAQAARCQSVRAATAAVIDWQGGVERLVRGGAAGEAADRVRSGAGNDALETCRREIEAFLDVEEQLDRDRVAALGRSWDQMTLLLGGGGVVAVVVALALAAAFRRGIARRFAALEVTARQLALGAEPPPSLRGSDEIALIDRILRSMAADLTRAAERIKDLYENAPCGYHSVGPDGTVEEMNRTELRWLGYAAAEVVGRVRFPDLMTEDSRRRFDDHFPRFRDSGEARDLEFELVRKDGSTFPVLLNATAVRDAAGRYATSRSTLFDMTDHKRAEDEVRRLNADLERRLADLARSSEALRASEEQFRLLVEGVQDYAILMLDPDGRIASWNAGAARIKGYDAAEAVGRHFSLFYPPDAVERGWPDHELEVARAEGRFEEEGWRVRKDGSRFWASVVISAIRDEHGHLRGFSKVTRDITERKRAEAEVRLFADVARNIPIGLLIYQLDGDPPVLRLRSGNRDASRLLKVELDGAAGLAVTDVFPAIPPDQLRRYTAVAASGVPDNLGEFRYGDDRVAERWWAVLAFPLPDRSVGVSFLDVTARRTAEDEVRQLNAGLELRVRQRTAELEAANRDLARRNDENEMFVYSVSHDLRSPLVNLQGFSRELEKAARVLATLFDGEGVPPAVQQEGRALLDGKVAKSVGFIQSAVLRLGTIIDALLRLSRAGRVEYRWEVVDVAGVVAHVVGASQGTATERGATVVVGALPPAWGDRAAVEQVFANLVGNAVAYLDPARPGQVEVGCLPSGDATAPPGYRAYYVRDNGLGIAEAHRAKIFQAFQRAHPGVGSGEGLGLAIVARAAERHGGRVWVESRPSEGSTFYVTLPAPAVADRG